LRPRKIVDANDIAAYALDLARHEAEDPDEMNLVQRLAQLMSLATVRASELAAADGRAG
jgi:hypothetical protein